MTAGRSGAHRSIGRGVWAASVVMLGTLGASPSVFAQDRGACLASYDAGQAARDARKLTKARAEFATCASATCPAVLRQDCLTWLAELDGVIPSVIARAVDERGRDMADVRVDLDGALWLGALDGKAMRVDPGEHTLRFRALGRPPIEERIVVAEGERNRVVTVRLAPRAPAPTAAPLRTPSLVPPLVAVGAAVVAFGGATYFYAKGIHDGEALRDECGSPPRCAQADADAVHTKLLVGDVLAGVGLVATGAAIYLFATRKPAATPASALRWTALGRKVLGF